MYNKYIYYNLSSLFKSFNLMQIILIYHICARYKLCNFAVSPTAIHAINTKRG